MSMANYGEHAERAAEAFDALIRGDRIPTTEDQVTLLLNARESVVSSLNERMRKHVAVDADLGGSDTSGNPLSLVTFEVDTILTMARAVAQLPRLPIEQRLSPVDVYATRDVDPAIAAWQAGGRELLAANHVLDRATEQPWRTTAGARFALAADTAQVLEAVTVLDHRLDEVGVFSGRLEVAGEKLHQLPDGRITARANTRATTRLLASHIDRLGQQYGDATQTDATEIKDPSPEEFREPIKMIRSPGDLAAAQDQLSFYLAPLNRLYVRPLDRISAMTANTIAFGHIELLKELHTRIAASPALRDHLPRITQLQELHNEARNRISGLNDARLPRINRVIRHQQQEISVAVKSGRVRQLSDQQVPTLLRATEGAVAMWAGAIATEGNRRLTDLRIVRRIKLGHVDYRKMKKDGPAIQALTALAQHKPVIPVSTHMLPTLNRTQLRDTLTRSPLGERPPHLRTGPTPRPPGLGR